MSERDVNEFLADCDDVIEDCDLEDSPDAASWAADGSHERTGPSKGLMQIIDSVTATYFAEMSANYPPFDPAANAASIAEYLLRRERDATPPTGSAAFRPYGDSHH